MRVVKSSNEFFDLLDKMPNGQFVTIGYVTSANLDVPKVSRKNPETGRMKGYPDYSVFGTDNEIGALVKISSYNMQYLNRNTVSKKYGEYKKSVNDIRANFGLEPMGDKDSYKQSVNWGNNSPELYKGSNKDLEGHSYNPQNIYSAKIKSVVYAVNNEGSIVQELKPEQVKPYLKKKGEVSGVSALRKMNTEEDKIQDFIKQINDLKFRYVNFEANSILWIAATVEGEKVVYINDNLQRAVDGINIKPEDFRAIARERYQIDLANLHEMAMKKANGNVIRLTESDFYKMINNAVMSCLNEEMINNDSSYTHYAVNKTTGKIANGWDYSGYEPDELRQFKKDYFYEDLADNGFNPKDYRILTRKSLTKMGINPNDNASWENLKFN